MKGERAARRLERMSEDQLRALPTHRLLAYYKSRHAMRDQIERGWNTDGEDKKWLDYFAFIKSLLDEREHIEG